MLANNLKKVKHIARFLPAPSIIYQIRYWHKYVWSLKLTLLLISTTFWHKLIHEPTYKELLSSIYTTLKLIPLNLKCSRRQRVKDPHRHTYNNPACRERERMNGITPHSWFIPSTRLAGYVNSLFLVTAQAIVMRYAAFRQLSWLLKNRPYLPGKIFECIAKQIIEMVTSVFKIYTNLFISCTPTCWRLYGGLLDYFIFKTRIKKLIVMVLFLISFQRRHWHFVFLSTQL